MVYSYARLPDSLRLRIRQNEAQSHADPRRQCPADPSSGSHSVRLRHSPHNPSGRRRDGAVDVLRARTFREGEITASAAEHRAKQEAIWESITGMAKRHNAIMDWRKRFLTKEKPEEAIYSAELSAALINSEHRPALFIVQVQDVVQADGNWK